MMGEEMGAEVRLDNEGRREKGGKGQRESEERAKGEKGSLPGYHSISNTSMMDYICNLFNGQVLRLDP